MLLRTPVVALAAGVIIGTLATAGALWAETTTKKPEEPKLDGAAPFDIVDTPGSTYLLNRTTGQVWRISFTDVNGNKYWYALHVPVQQPQTFEDFQTKLRRELQSSSGSH